MAEYVGLDVSKEATSFCVKDAAGKVLARGEVATAPQALFKMVKAYCLCPGRIVMETGTLSGWLARDLAGLGIVVDVIDARQANAVMRLQHNKTDANDAELLAEIARTGFCRALAATIEPLLSSVAALKHEIERLDKTVMARAKGDPACRLLTTAPGVGPVTALAFVATIDDAERFAASRAVGAYVGLTSRRWQSGEMDYSGRISKHGDATMLRSLLFEAANSLLTVVRRAHPLKDWARRVRKRTNHKKACVALARKLAVILHRMLITGEAFRWPEKEAATTA